MLTLALASILIAFALIFTIRQADALSISGYGSESAGITADGSRYDGTGFTAAASPIYPMHSTLRVCYLPKDSCVVVYVNDATPRLSDFDLSQEAATALGIWGTAGRCYVGVDCTVEVVG